MLRPSRFLVRLDVQSWLQRVAFLTGGYESKTTIFLMRLWEARNGSGYLLDVGANVGMITIPCALQLQSRSTVRPVVIAVEAVPDNVKALKLNVELNDLGHSVTVLGAALGDVEKIVDIQVEGNLSEGDGAGTANILPDGSGYECVRQKLAIHTIDNLFEQG